MNQRAELLSPPDGVTDEVRSFYDRYPYPRPVDSLEQYSRLWDDPLMRRADHHLFWPHKPYREDHSILIAGCGTSQAAKHALRWPKAQVSAIDLSATSVRHTEELKRKYNLANLQAHQLPLDHLHELKATFDQIVCTGVLHHLSDPDAGLADLRSVLKTDGAMHLMVYAPYGRTGVYMLQDFAKRLGILSTDEGIRDLIVALHALPPGHPLESLLREAPDFRQEAALADALLHPQDRAYSVPQLFDFVERGQLTFARWLKQAHYSSNCGVMAQIPQSSRLANLPANEQYAAVELFRGTMVRHSIIVYRNDRSACTPAIRFTDNEWQSYVPIRMSNTISVEERLPPGAAAVLINRSHSYRDIFLPINSLEKGLFDAVDGARTIGEILTHTSPSLSQFHRDKARSFFERLWWHDQVVFDTSRT